MRLRHHPDPSDLTTLLAEYMKRLRETQRFFCNADKKLKNRIRAGNSLADANRTRARVEARTQIRRLAESSRAEEKVIATANVGWLKRQESSVKVGA
jgi:hypothetical protein